MLESRRKQELHFTIKITLNYRLELRSSYLLDYQNERKLRIISQISSVTYETKSYIFSHNSLILELNAFV